MCTTTWKSWLGARRTTDFIGYVQSAIYAVRISTIIIKIREKVLNAWNQSWMVPDTVQLNKFWTQQHGAPGDSLCTRQWKSRRSTTFWHTRMGRQAARWRSSSKNLESRSVMTRWNYGESVMRSWRRRPHKQPVTARERLPAAWFPFLEKNREKMRRKVTRVQTHALLAATLTTASPTSAPTTALNLLTALSLPTSLRDHLDDSLRRTRLPPKVHSRVITTTAAQISLPAFLRDSLDDLPSRRKALPAAEPSEVLLWRPKRSTLCEKQQTKTTLTNGPSQGRPKCSQEIYSLELLITQNKPSHIIHWFKVSWSSWS